MRLTLTEFVSLDGVVQGPGGADEDTGGGFTRGGWVMPLFEERLGAWVSEKFEVADAFLLGRRTFDIFAGYWPRATDPDDVVARRLNEQPKFVVSRTLRQEDADWHGTVVVSAGGDALAARITELKEQPGRELQVHGSGTLGRWLLGRGLLDEVRLLVFPVVLGQGRRLFPEGTDPAALRLTGTRSTPTGVTILTYEPAGTPAYAESPPPPQGS